MHHKHTIDTCNIEAQDHNIESERRERVHKKNSEIRERKRHRETDTRTQTHAEISISAAVAVAALHMTEHLKQSMLIQNSALHICRNIHAMHITASIHGSLARLFARLRSSLSYSVAACAALSSHSVDIHEPLVSLTLAWRMENTLLLCALAFSLLFLSLSLSIEY